MTTAAKATTSPPRKGETTSVPAQPKPRAEFMVAALNMSWQLAIVVLVPIIGGVQIDKAAGKNSNIFTFIGLGLALIGSGFVMWRAVQVANRLPVPKLSAAQKKAIQKQYEEDDKDV